MTEQLSTSPRLNEYAATVKNRKNFRTVFINSLIEKLKQRGEHFDLAADSDTDLFCVTFWGLRAEFEFAFQKGKEALCIIKLVRAKASATPMLGTLEDGEVLKKFENGAYVDYQIDNFVKEIVVKELEYDLEQSEQAK